MQRDSLSLSPCTVDIFLFYLLPFQWPVFFFHEATHFITFHYSSQQSWRPICHFVLTRVPKYLIFVVTCQRFPWFKTPPDSLLTNGSMPPFHRWRFLLPSLFGTLTVFVFYRMSNIKDGLFLTFNPLQCLSNEENGITSLRPSIANISTNIWATPL